MPKLPSVNGREVVAAFEKLGFSVDRITDTHHIMKKPGFIYLLSVPVHKSKAMKRGTLRSLIRDAEITVEEFIAALKE